MILKQNSRRERPPMAIGWWLTLAVVMSACGPSIRPCAGVTWDPNWKEEEECNQTSFMFEDWCWQHTDENPCNADLTGCGTTIVDGVCQPTADPLDCREGTSNINISRYPCKWQENNPEIQGDEDCQCDYPNNRQFVQTAYTLCQNRDREQPPPGP